MSSVASIKASLVLVRRALLSSESARFAGYASAYTLVSAAHRILGFLVFLWLARTLSVEEFAVFGLLYALHAGVATFSQSGIQEVTIGQLSSNPAPSERRALYGRGIRAFMALALIASAITLSVFFVVKPMLAHRLGAALAAAASAVFAGYLSIQQSFLRLEERHRDVLLLSMAGPFAAFALAIAVVHVRPSADSVFTAFAIAYAAMVLVSVALQWGYRGVTGTEGTAIRWFSALMPYVAVALVGWLGGYGANYFIEALTRPAEVARYTFLFTVASALQLVATALNQVWAPRFYRIATGADTNELERQNRIFCAMQGVALGLFAAVVLVGYPTALTALGGDMAQYQLATADLSCLLLGYVSLIPWWHCQNYFLVHGQGVALMHAMVWGGILGIGLWVVLIGMIGPAAIYGGFLVQCSTRMLVAFAVARRRWPIRMAWESVATGAVIIGLGYVLSKALD